MEAAACVLVVDDDATMLDVVGRYLARAGFQVLTAADGPTALRVAAERDPDLVVLDVMLPGLDGFEVCRRLRERAAVPVVMLTALGEEDDRVLGLELGADDYVTKPFSPRELVLRVQAVLRRVAPPPVPPGGGDLLRDGGLVVDLRAHEAALDGGRLTLTVREYDLLVHLLRHPGRVRSRGELLREVWGWSFGDASTVTVHVRRLRAKLGDTGAARIVTVWGVGYRWEPQDTPAARGPGTGAVV